jgi:DNA-binding response OmpR family regulator
VESKTVLVVEDDRSDRELLTCALQSVGYRVLSAKTGEEARSAVGNADLMMLDLSLPGLSGESLLAEIRSKGNLIPTIVVSGTSDENLKHRLRAMKIVDFIEKPFANDELLSRVERAMGISQSMKSIEQYDLRIKGFIDRQRQR